MAVYLDASVLLALFTNDAFTARADAFLRRRKPTVCVSDFGAAEFSSAVARRVRMKELTRKEGEAAFSTFDAWIERTTHRVEVLPSDVRVTESFLRRLDLNLRTADALNLAIAQRVNADLATFDRKMAAAARTLQIAVART